MDTLLVHFTVLTTIVGSYQANREFIGCFRKGIGENRQSDPLHGDVLSWNLTTKTCRNFCLQKDGIYYYGTSSGGRCYCWGSAANFRYYGILPQEACNIPCKGNQSEMCGSNEALSMFADIIGICNNVSIQNGFSNFNSSVLTTSCQSGFTVKGNPILQCDLAKLFSQNLTLQSQLPTCNENEKVTFSLEFLILFSTILILALCGAAGALMYFIKRRTKSQRNISSKTKKPVIEQSYGKGIEAVDLENSLSINPPVHLASVSAEHDVKECLNVKYENMCSPIDSPPLPPNPLRHFWFDLMITANSASNDFKDSSSPIKTNTDSSSFKSHGESEIGADIYYIPPKPSENNLKDGMNKNVKKSLTHPLESSKNSRMRRSLTLRWTPSFQKFDLQNLLPPIYGKVNKKDKKGGSKPVIVSLKVNEVSEGYEKVIIENS